MWEFAHLIDFKQFDRLGEVMTDDILYSFPNINLTKKGLDNVIAFETGLLGPAEGWKTQHIMATESIRFEPGSKKASAIVYFDEVLEVPQLPPQTPNATIVTHSHVYYNDTWLHTDKGWKIQTRIGKALVRLSVLQTPGA